ncbi:MAG: hypothetical protein P8Z78_10130 [Gammaproteobacteria bacterium]
MHQPSPQSASSRSSRAGRTARRLAALLVTIQAACWAPQAMADARLTYGLSGPDGNKSVKHFSIARFFVRIDDPADTGNYLLYQAGKFFPLFSVDTSKKTWTRLTPPVKARLGPLPPAQKTPPKDGGKSVAHDHASQKSASEMPAGQMQSGTLVASETAATSTRTLPLEPGLKASKKTDKVAGIDCRIVHELVDNEPVIEHCMANSARLGITDRELITLSRLFKMAREKDYDWMAIGTRDEEFVSIRSRDLGNNRVMELTSVDTTPLPAGYLRVPKHYKEVELKTPAAE